jgi:hypothetical protein
MLSLLVSIWNLLTKSYSLLGNIGTWVLQLNKVVGGFFITAGAIIVSVVAWLADVGQLVIDAIAGKGELGVYVNTILEGKVPTDIAMPALESEIGQVALSWLGFLQEWIPMDVIWNSFLILFGVFLFAATVRTIKAWIPTLT